MSLHSLLVLGAGGHAAVVIDAATGTGLFGEVTIVDDDPELIGGWCLDRPIVATCDAALEGKVQFDEFIVAIGDNRLRALMFERFRAIGSRPATIVHPSAVVAPSATVGGGTIVNAGAVLNACVTIGQNAIVNTSAAVDHHVSVADDVHIAPGVTLGGDVQVDGGALVGIGATVMPRRRIGSWAVVGAGALIAQDVEANSVVIGVPALPINPRS